MRLPTLFRRNILLNRWPWIALACSSAQSFPLGLKISTTTTTAHPPFLFRGGQQQQPLLYSTTTPEVDTKVDTTTMSPSAKLEQLRGKMQELDLDVYIVPTDDPHLSEYVPLAYARRAFLTDFQGSAGTAVVTKASDAYVWTDSRYWNEASKSLDSSCWTLQKAGLPSTPTISKWLAEQAVVKYSESQQPLKVGLDPLVFPASYPEDVHKACIEKAKTDLNMELKDDSSSVLQFVTEHENLIDPIWGDARPPIPASPFTVHKLDYAGVSWQDKVDMIREEMQSSERKATLAVFSALDDVAYLLNMRSQGDIDTCPVGIAYATVSEDEVTLYCDERKVASSEVQEHLQGVTLKPYDAILSDVQKHCETTDNAKVWLEKARSNLALCNVIPEEALLNAQNAVVPMKACKNEAELEGMRKAHIVDGAAMANFISWLEDQIVEKGNKISEVEIDEKLTGCRAAQPGFKECSFPTIAGVGPNGAIVHYRASADSPLMQHLDKSQPILIDSGGQYEYGTTDVTRTWHFGEPSAEFVNFYTRVLKGNIGLDSMIFPEKTPGFALDIYARQHLWEIGHDYGHGTGHGVGAALNVHEGPFGISPRWTNSETLKAGMVVSNEPGYYKDGEFGIRIENLLEIEAIPKPDDADESTKSFLKFNSLTMIPIQKNLIDLSIMTKKELDWLDSYHEEVFQKVSPLLEKDSPAMAWLEKMCAKIER